MIKLTKQAASKIQEALERKDCVGKARLRIESNQGRFKLHLERLAQVPPKDAATAEGIPVTMDEDTARQVAGLELDYVPSQDPAEGGFIFRPAP
ncbi:MAG: hypothetical protein ABII00_01560 [Elusimicrobiota bacterium]